MKQRMLCARLMGGCALWIACSACLAPPVGEIKTVTSQDTPVHVSLNQQNKVDILFMVDNSSSMGAMQQQLVQRFGQFLQVFSDLAHPSNGATPQFADLHIGVVTSDYGAGDKDGSGCQKSPGGQKGILQATAAPGTPLAGCAGPASGGLFIQYKFSAGGDSCNLPGGTCDATTLGTTFTCMASVGASGCGFEHQLESVYAALQKDNSNNAGFLRDDALLAVVFVTNEDDGSAPPTSTIYEAPANTRSLTDPNIVANGPYDTFRQTEFGVGCGSPLALLSWMTPSAGALTCSPVPTPTLMLGGEYPVQRYIDFFSGSNGVKSDPSNVILVGLDALDDDVETELVLGTTGCGAVSSTCSQATYQSCSALDLTSDCVMRLKHECQNSADPAFFGDPAVRLNAVIRAVNPPLPPAQPSIYSICGDDPTKEPDYTSTLQAVAQRIVSQLKPPCIPAPLLDPTDPQCVVEDVTTTNGVTSTTEILRCDKVNNQPPCWTVGEDAADCPCVQAMDKTQSHPSISIVRDQPIPDNTVAKVSCSTQALPSYSCQ